jgi:hypothetical protein
MSRFYKKHLYKIIAQKPEGKTVFRRRKFSNKGNLILDLKYIGLEGTNRTYMDKGYGPKTGSCETVKGDEFLYLFSYC